MSFSRAPLKRFNEHIGCAPPPGSYDIKSGDVKGAASFNKSDRFRATKAAAGADLLPPSPSRSAFISPVRRTLSVDGLTTGSSGKREGNGMTFEKKQLKLLEKEIRSLVQQRGEQDRRLLALEDDLKKSEAKLLAAVREKTGLSASVITLERQRAELKKVNEFLKNKVSSDTTKKRINSLTMELMEVRNNLDVKNQELSLLQVNTEGQLKVLETDFQAARATVSTLQDRNKDLEDLHEVTKSRNVELENENERLNGEIQELREEVRVLQEYLDAANEQIQDLRLQIQERTQEDVVGSKGEKLKRLETELEQRTEALQTTQDLLKQKEAEVNKFQQELQTSKDALWNVEKMLEYQNLELQSAQRSVIDTEKQMKSARQEVEDSQTTVRQQEAELTRLREVLRRTERELDERVAHLEQKCLLSDEERGKAQEEGFRKVEQLKNELIVLQQAKRDERKRQIQLEQEHSALAEELAKEKALVDSLTVLVETEREETEEQMRRLKEEMEEVLGELAVMEEQEQIRLEVAQKSQEALQSLQRDKEELANQLREAEALLERSSDVAAMKAMHLAAVSELQEAYNNSQKKIEDFVTELESTREALKEAKGRQRELEAEVGRVTCQLKEAMDKMVEQKEEEINRVRGWTDEQQERLQAEAKSKEESLRALHEVQTCLAQKEEEVKAAQASHAAQLDLLQKELQAQMSEKEDALRLLEEQRQGFSEREKSQKMLEDLSWQKEEISQQLQEEREAKLKLHVALQEEKVAFEVEQNNHEQLRSEVLKLQADLETLDQERRSLLSEVELKKDSSHALENRLSAAERDRDQFQARLDDVEQENAGLRAQLERSREKAAALAHELDKQQQHGSALREQLEALTQEKVTLQWEMEEQRQELQRQLAEAQEKSSPHSEMERWRKQYEELFVKVTPFQEQLNAFAAERDALLNENGANQEELNKLADAYARLLGHQNQKQKIKHVMKLKDENISLKQEVSKLRSLVSRQKSDLEQLRAKLPGAPRRRFDPSKAFQNNKENIQTDTNDPLGEGNHKE
ncbi:hyaluronan mediated motility receptor isoform X1 [Poecilia latipinna]|uniref:hyaluronan mediated motility receptor isoform X1 n=1 Tax=Poecilia latipinna TaxID=48699 RepID=UPI00072E9700|nr:PREDICTED: hyaluronan mediated motility receptor isoform X1 [Poecilia latipinna]